MEAYRRRRTNAPRAWSWRSTPWRNARVQPSSARRRGFHAPRPAHRPGAMQAGAASRTGAERSPPFRRCSLLGVSAFVRGARPVSAVRPIRERDQNYTEDRNAVKDYFASVAIFS